MRSLWALLLASILLPLAAASPTDVTFSAGPVAGTVVQDHEERVPYMGTGKVPFTLHVGCAVLLQAAAANGGRAVASVAVVGAPSWVNAPAVVGELSPTGCANQDANVTYTGELSFTLDADAPGVVTHALNISATVGATKTPSVPVPFAVEYHADYSVVPAAEFPVRVTNGTASFDVTVTQRSNARSMVMVEEVKASTGQLSGLPSIAYDNPPTSKTFSVTYKAPTTGWSEAKVTAKTFSHYLLPPPSNAAGAYAMEKDLEFTFVNASPAGSTSATSKASPAGGLLLVAGALGLALAARRRSA